jgi:hypothetical protein
MGNVLNILDWLRRVPGGFLLAVSIVLGLLIFLPDSVADTLAVKEFRTAYRMFLGPALLLAASFGLTKLITAAWHLWRDRRNANSRIRQLHELTPEEKGYLRRFLIDGVNTIHVAFGDGVAGGLEAKGIIYVSSDTVNILEGIAYNLHSWARKELSENVGLLAGAIGRPMTNEERVFGKRY